MTENTKIKYTFHNEIGESVDMIFTMLEIEGMVGGFMNHILELLDDMGFGAPIKVYRMALIK